MDKTMKLIALFFAVLLICLIIIIAIASTSSTASGASFQFLQKQAETSEKCEKTCDNLMKSGNFTCKSWIDCHAKCMNGSSCSK